MDSATIAKLGILFLGLGLAATFLMYWLWGFPFDKETRTSAAPRSLMYTHRALGYLFVLCYLAIMWHMVPRLWHYQVEFPARTVAHIILGFTIGFLLLIKIAIMRFFRHFEEWMPFLGTGIMLGTVLLIGLSVPFVFQERALAGSAPGGSVYSTDSLARVGHLLPMAGLPESAPMDELTTAGALREGRAVLLDNCVKCHDLKTILAKPRTPSSWYRTVIRMAEKPALFEPISEREQWQVTAYLVAITPDLKRSIKQIRETQEKREALQAAVIEGARRAGDSADEGDQGSDQNGDTGDQADETDSAGGEVEVDTPVPPAVELAGARIDGNKARQVFQDECSLCHELSDIDANPPRTVEDIDPLIQRMIENDMEVAPEDLKLIKWYLLKHYVAKTVK